MIGGALGTLAVHGGQPVRSTPFPARGVVTEAEKVAVNRLLDHAITTGEPIRYGGVEEAAYCAAFAANLGGGYADGVSSGTAAVFIALRALELEPRGEVVVSPITDPGGIMPVVLCDCVPVVADAAPGSYNVGVHEVEACITERTRAIVVAHIAGEPADVAGISALATRHGIPLVEDCAQAHAARLHGRPLGTYGQIAAFSTMFDKHHHTGGQGGVVYTADRALHENARRHADRGKPFGLAPGSTSVVAALNLNMDELHAAIGRVQLDRLHDNVDRRRRVAGALAAQVASVTSDAVIVPPQIAGAEPSFWYLRLRIDIARLSCSKPEFAAALAAEGIPLRGEAVLPHSHSWFAHDGTADTNPSLSTDALAGAANRRRPCPNAVGAAATHVGVAIHERWGEREVADTLDALAKVAAAYGI